MPPPSVHNQSINFIFGCSHRGPSQKSRITISVFYFRTLLPPTFMESQSISFLTFPARSTPNGPASQAFASYLLFSCFERPRRSPSKKSTAIEELLGGGEAPSPLTFLFLEGLGLFGAVHCRWPPIRSINGEGARKSNN